MILFYFFNQRFEINAFPDVLLESVDKNMKKKWGMEIG